MRPALPGVCRLPAGQPLLQQVRPHALVIKGNRCGVVAQGDPHRLGRRVRELLAQHVLVVLEQQAHHLAPGVRVAEAAEDLEVRARRPVDVLCELVAPLPELLVACCGA